MNLDSDVRGLKRGDYRKLTNGITVTAKGASRNGLDGNVCNIAGNTAQAQGGTAALPTGSNRVVGALEDRVGGRLFYFVAHTTPANDAIYQYVQGSGITLVMRSTLLGLSSATFVSADIVGDLLTFTTGLGEPLQINVADAIAGGIYTPSLEQVTLIKRGPQVPLTLTPTGASRTVNSIRYNTFQFYHRFIYRDNAYSVFSPVSQALQTTGSTIDAIDVLTPTANIPVTATKVEYAFKKNGTNELTIYRSDTLPLGTASHRFYNDTNLETVPDSETTSWFDSVPLKSKALKFHENRLFLFGNTEGYTLTGSPLPEATAGTTDGTGAVLKDDSVYGVGVQFYDQMGRIIGLRKVDDVETPRRDNGATGPDSKKITVDLSMVSTANIPLDAYSFSVLRTKNKSVSYFISSVSADVWFRKTLSDGTYEYSKLPTSSDPTFDILIDSTNLNGLEMGYTFNEGDRLKLWDRAGGVFDFPITGQDGKYIVAKYSFILGYGGLGTFNTRADVFIFEVYTPKTNNLELYYEVGHRAAIDNPGGGSRAFSSTTVVIPGDVYVSERTSYGPFTTGPTAARFYLTYASTGYSPADPDNNSASYLSATAATFPNEFYSFTPETKSPNWSIWADGVGRSVGYDADGALQIAKKAVRFSNEYIQNSRQLGLNTFGALDEQYLSVDNGTPEALASAGDVLVALFDIESVALYIGEGFISTAEGNQFLAKTDQVIGDDRRYTGGYGTSHPASVVSRDGRVYWLDIKKQAVIRRGQDGLTPISDYGLKSFIGLLCDTYNSLSESNVRITAGWDPQHECYCLCFFNTAAPTIANSMTLYFHEKSNAWVSRTDLRPEFFGTLFNRQITFLSGALWTQAIESMYNNFFGVQYDRQLECEIGQDSLEKIWEAIEVDAESIFSTAGTNEDVVLLYHIEGGTLQNRINYLDFNLRGSAYRASFFRNLNDASMGSTTESKYKSSHNTRGQSAFLKINYNGTDQNPMKSITVFFRPSMNSTP